MGDNISLTYGKCDPNIVTHVNLEGSGNTMSLVVGRANIITRISSLEDFTVTISNISLTYGKCDHTALVIFT
jgi:hypothetical protein